MNLLDYLHRLARRIGVKPTLFDPLALAVVGAIAGWIIDGTLDVLAVKLAAAGVLLGLITPGSDGILDELHRLAERLGLSPKVLDPLVIGAVVVAANWIETGVFDAGELKLAIATALYGLVGFAAPAGVGVTQAEVNQVARRRRGRIDGSSGYYDFGQNSPSP